MKPSGLVYFGTHHMPFTARVFHQRLDQIHVRPVLVERHRDELHAERLREVEVPVHSPAPAEELDHRLLRPGPRAVRQPVRIRLGNQVVHEVQTGVAAHDHLFRPDAQQLRKEALAGGQPVQAAVVAHVVSRR